MSPLTGIALLLFSIGSLIENLHAIWHFVCELGHTFEALSRISAQFHSNSLIIAQFSIACCKAHPDTIAFHSRTPGDLFHHVAYPVRD